MSSKLDSIDRKLLTLLQRNARISNAELAERVNLSPTPCLRRENGEILERALSEQVLVSAPGWVKRPWHRVGNALVQNPP